MPTQNTKDAFESLRKVSDLSLTLFCVLSQNNCITIQTRKEFILHQSLKQRTYH